MGLVEVRWAPRRQVVAVERAPVVLEVVEVVRRGQKISSAVLE